MTETSTDSPSRGYIETLQSYYDAEQRYVAAGGARAGADFSEMAAHLHPEVVAHQGPTVPYPGDWHGVDGVQEFFALFSETWSSLELTEIHYFEGEAGLAIKMRMRATAVATGKKIDTLVGHFLIFEGGLIREFSVLYQDPVQVLEATRH